MRKWLLKILLTEDERYLLTRAIEDRKCNLGRIAVNEKWADKNHIAEDVKDYEKILTIIK